MNEYKVVYHLLGSTITEYAYGDDLMATGNPGEMCIVDYSDRVVAFFSNVVSLTKARTVE